MAYGKERSVDMNGLSLEVDEIKTGTSGTVATLSQIAGITAGTSAASKALVLDANKELDWTYTNASTSGSTSVEPFNLDTTLTGVGGVGGRAKFTLTTNVALGAWSNALKGEVTYGASGKTTGLGSAVVAEMTLSAGTATGTYAPLEIELNLGTGALTGTQSSFLYASVNGDDIATFNTNGFALSLNGLTIGSGNIVQTIAEATVASTHSLRIAIDGTTYYIPLNTSQAF